MRFSVHARVVPALPSAPPSFAPAHSDASSFSMRSTSTAAITGLPSALTRYGEFALGSGPSRSWPPPPLALRFEQRVARRRTPRARIVVGERDAFLFPRPVLEDRHHDLPAALGHVLARIQRRIAEDAVEQQPLVGLGELHAERRSIAEV